MLGRKRRIKINLTVQVYGAFATPLFHIRIQGDSLQYEKSGGVVGNDVEQDSIPY